jgi:hypothetical protein
VNKRPTPEQSARKLREYADRIERDNPPPSGTATITESVTATHTHTVTAEAKHGQAVKRSNAKRKKPFDRDLYDRLKAKGWPQKRSPAAWE